MPCPVAGKPRRERRMIRRVSQSVAWDILTGNDRKPIKRSPFPQRGIREGGSRKRVTFKRLSCSGGTPHLPNIIPTKIA